MNQFGCNVEVKTRVREIGAVKTVFIRDDSIARQPLFSWPRGDGIQQKIMVKLEIDTNPPAGGNIITMPLDFPYPHKVKTEDLRSQFALKSHALLCRAYEKGRDWFDFLWYVDKKTEPNYTLLSTAMNQQGPWKGQNVNTNRSWLEQSLTDKIKTLDFSKIKEDALNFTNEKEQDSIDKWDASTFLAAVDKFHRYGIKREQSRRGMSM
jgi:hypothetical protein